jgi:hypothetical protein
MTKWLHEFQRTRAKCPEDSAKYHNKLGIPIKKGKN